MTTEEAITRLNSLLDSITNVYIFFSKKNMFSSRTNILSEDTIAIKMAIKALSEQEEQKWVPCSEGMPEDGQEVLFCDIDNDVMKGYHVKGRPKTHFSQDGTYEDKKNVIAWRPSPYPYTERQEE